MKRNRNDRGQFENEYDWPKLIPNICSQSGYPTRWQVWNVIRTNAEYTEEWRIAVAGRLELMKSDFDLLADAIEDGMNSGTEINTTAAWIWLRVICLRISHLERVCQKYDKPGISLRKTMTEARQRLEAKNAQAEASAN